MKVAELRSDRCYRVAFTLEMPSGAKHQCSIVIEGHHVSLLGGLAATVLHRARCRGGIQTSDPLVAVSMGEGCTVRVLDVTESP